MEQRGIAFQPGTLWGKILETVRRAESSGALFPFPTAYEFIDEKNVRFFVRILTALASKDEEKKKRDQAGPSANPFLPYDSALFVTDVSDTHLVLLNKFNVVQNHILIVTKKFEPQENLLTPGDFEALYSCLCEYESLGFYNAGVEAGASQPHKHLQLVPLPLAPEGPPIPIEPLLYSCEDSIDGIRRIPDFPFLHAFCFINEDGKGAEDSLYLKAHRMYTGMLRSCGLNGSNVRTPPYCFLMTRTWMLLVPRSTEFFEGISINSLGFAGAMLVRNHEQLEVLKKYGPFTALKSVALAL